MTPEAVAAEAVEIQRLCREQEITVRLIGSLAIAARCPLHRWLMPALGRREPRDIDLVTYASHERSLHELLSRRGYLLHPSVSHSREWGVNRLIYTHQSHDGKVDVFLDQLVMAHKIDFTGRLDGESVTVSLADLLLSKLQIYRITSNDLIDLTVLLAEVDVGSGPGDIDLGRVREVLGADWGFAHGAELNLARLIEVAESTPALDSTIAARVQARANRLLGEIESAPKSLRWRLRSRIGERAPWYEHVDDVDV